MRRKGSEPQIHSEPASLVDVWPDTDPHPVTPARHGPEYFERLRTVADRYFKVFPAQRKAIIDAHRAEAAEIERVSKIDLAAVSARMTATVSDEGVRWPHALLVSDDEISRRLRGWLLSDIPYYGGVLGTALTISSIVPILSEAELLALVDANDFELQARPPVTIQREIVNAPLGDFDAFLDGLSVAILGFPAVPYTEMDGRLRALLDDFAVTLFENREWMTGVENADVRAAYRAFAVAFYPWANAKFPLVEGAKPRYNILPRMIPQPTFPEAKRIARGLAYAPDGVGWSAIIGEFALIHEDKSNVEHLLRLEGGLIPEWWGRPSDNDSLRRELAETGHDGIALLYNAIGLVLHSDEGHVDVEVDELISRIGIDPRSKAERVNARLKVWRILTILGALRVIGARRRVVRDRVTGKSVQIESADPLLTVSAWKRVGTQETFDAGVAPLAVTLMPSPWLSRLRGNHAALQDFGNLLAISEIPIGKPSGAWARAVGFTLQQLWREQATRATYGRSGDDKRPTARFRGFTRRELLEMFPPKPSVSAVLGGKDPRRAIDYWDRAIEDLRARRIIAHYAGTRGWDDRARKGWADLWLDEPLDIRPAAEATNALSQIAGAAKKKRRGDSKLRESTVRR